MKEITSRREENLGPLRDIAGGAELTATALRVFYGIADAWKLSEQEQASLLGLSHRLDAGQVPDVGSETIQRISYMLGIFSAINTLLPIPERADAWMRAPNAAPPFLGRSALEFMVTGDVSDLQLVRKYLDSQLA
jgi:hypothetical protein